MGYFQEKCTTFAERKKYEVVNSFVLYYIHYYIYDRFIGLSR